MRLAFYRHPGVYLGSATVIDGIAVFEPAVERYAVTAIEPRTYVVLGPKDGERYLRALPLEFRSGYVWANIVEE